MQCINNDFNSSTCSLTFQEEDEGIELKTISSSASVSPDESMSPNLQKEFFPNQFKRKLAATKG